MQGYALKGNRARAWVGRPVISRDHRSKWGRVGETGGSVEPGVRGEDGLLRGIEEGLPDSDRTRGYWPDVTAV